MIRTKDDILNSAMVSINDQLALPPEAGAGSRPLSSLNQEYDFIVPSQIEAFPYVFSFDSQLLQTPIELDVTKYPANTTNSRYYQRPEGLGTAFCVVTADYVHTALSLLSKGTRELTRYIPTVRFNLVPPNYIKVESDEENLYLLYTNTNVGVEYMSAPFKQAVKLYLVGFGVYRFTTSKAQAVRIQKHWYMLADAEITEARRINFDTASPEPSAPTLDDVMRYGQPDGSLNQGGGTVYG